MTPLFPVGFLLDTTALVASYDNVQDAAYLVETGATLPGRDLTTAHTIHQALPGRSWPVGRAVATTRPDLYEDFPIPVFPIDT
ncbi:MAG: hypothetical protein ACT4NY_21570 [Pseudonocardiales bacterium]